HLMAAEGSDWFWWYSENQHTLDADVFDALFRAHVSAVYVALGEAVPAAVTEPIYAERVSRLSREATGWMRASIDGRISHYFEWLSAALLRTSGLASAMQRSQFVLHEIYLGFDQRNLWLRLDTEGPAAERLAQCELEVVFAGERERVLRITPGAEPGAIEVDGDLREEAECAADRIIEARVPLAAIRAEPGDVLRVAVVIAHEGRTIERWPELGFLEVEVPTEEAIAERWFV
ncbi:MAG: hypothetical protein AB7Y46_19305, partial [Armatimonadota bacterium]